MVSENPVQATNRIPPDDWREVPLTTIADVRFSSVDKLTRPSEEPVRLCNYIDVYTNYYISAPGKAGVIQPVEVRPR